MTETHTLQVWPSGRGYEYRGDPNGPAEQRQLRIHDYNARTRTRWRKGKLGEWREIVISRRAEMYQRNEILGCDSCLVDDLVKAAAAGETSGDLGDGFGDGEIHNMYPDPSEWDAAQCRGWLEGHGTGDTAEWGLDIEVVRDNIRDNAEPAEVYEWWRITSWLCTQLHEIGEVTIDNGYGCWWGRCCTGQGYLMDGTLQRVAARFD
jgi:hypothetical protein